MVRTEVCQAARRRLPRHLRGREASGPREGDGCPSALAASSIPRVASALLGVELVRAAGRVGVPGIVADARRLLSGITLVAPAGAYYLCLQPCL
ncbi:MAG: hypothetical protein ACREQ5_20805 [Candidatus Dormibacteria bacterium]